MSGDTGAIKRAAGMSPAGVSAPPTLPPASSSNAGYAARLAPKPLAVDLPPTAPDERLASLDARLAERMHGLMLSPAMASMTQRASVLHSVVSWLEAQASSAALAPTVDVLKQEIFLIEAFHRGALHDVEGPRE
jgi:hypothetical protein